MTEIGRYSIFNSDRSMRAVTALFAIAGLLVSTGCTDPGSSDDEAAGETEIRHVDGVTDNEIRIGSHTDLTGPIALYGVESTNGARMRFDEVNEAGGVHGRMINFIVEDSQYDVTRSVSAANKLLNQDKIFAMYLALGTPNNNAVLTKQLPMGVPNLFPLTGSIEMAEPFHKLKFTQRGIYYDEMTNAIRHFVGELGKERPCTMYIDNDYGHEVMRGAQDELIKMGMDFVEKTSHKPTDSEFTAALLKLRAADCDLVILGTVIRDTIQIFESVRKMDWTSATWVGNNAAAGQPVAGIESGASEGYYAYAHMIPIYPDSETDPVKLSWYNQFVEKYGAVPDVPAMEGFRGADLIVNALESAGPDLTRESFIAALEGMTVYQDIFGYTLSYGPDDHTGVDSSFLIRVEDRKWVIQDVTFEYD